MGEIVEVKIEYVNDCFMVSSRQVAEDFGKRHDQVLRDIEKHIESLQEHQNTKVWADMFVVSSYAAGTGKQYKEYYMSRDGFSLLVMSFNNTRDVLQWKLKYIKAFNMMEAELNKPELIMARALKLADSTINSLRIELKQQEPFVDFAKTVSKSADTISMGEMAKLLYDEGIKIGRNKLLLFLRAKKVLMHNNMPYQKYMNNGLFEVNNITKQTVYGEKVYPTTFVTGKGQIFIAEIIRKGYIGK
jgi:anti-repressor protein